MARLYTGEKQTIARDIFRLLRSHNNGLSEQEIAQLAQMDRRRVNNYLRELAGENKIYQDGRYWFGQ